MRNQHMASESDAVKFSCDPCAQPMAPVMPAPGALQMITPQDLEELQQSLSKGALPKDFEAKLTRLSKETLLHQFVEQNCRLFAALLVGARQSSFAEASDAARERLLRVLAYVRKEEDEVPDYKPDGFQDDLREVRSATNELSSLLQAFKTWRLRHQVPSMWASERIA